MSHATPFVFILSWERPIYTWVCLDSLYRSTKSPVKFVIADNASRDPMVKQVIEGFRRRGMFHAVHYFSENDPARLGRLVDMYDGEIGEYFAFVESDICIIPPAGDWLTTILDHFDADPKIGAICSRVHQPDFVSLEAARTLEPEMTTLQLQDLIKANAPMRRHVVTDEPLVSKHNPALRLLVVRKKAYEEVGFGRDYVMHRDMLAKGWKSMVSNEVAHRHLSLLNIFDYPDYDTHARNQYFGFRMLDTGRKPPLPKPNGVIILGMHRSGTSCLAGSLQQSGLHLGDVVTSSPFNRKGNRESRTAMHLHEEVLSANGGAWHKPPRSITWSNDHLHRLETLIASYPSSGLWGIKDPRALLLIDAWIERLEAPRFVASLRHPLAVARSLRGRNKGFQDDAQLLALWYEYNVRLLELWKKSPFPIVNFDCTGDAYLRQIETIAAELGLPGVNAGAETFFDDGLRHHQVLEGEIPSHVADLYAELLQAAERGR